MPDIRENSTIEALAQVFTTNGRKQEQAMIAVGYTPAYANSYCGKMWDNPRVKAAIARIDKKQAQIGHRTVENLDSMYQSGFDIAETQKNPAAMATNATGIARLYGYDKDNDVGNKESLPTVTTEQAMLYKKMAQIAIEQDLKGPKLSKETA